MYYGPERERVGWRQLRRADVVVTTYGVVVSEWKRREAARAQVKKPPFLLYIAPLSNPSSPCLTDAQVQLSYLI